MLAKFSSVSIKAYRFPCGRRIQARRESLGFQFSFIATRCSGGRKQHRGNFRVISHDANFSGTKRSILVAAEFTLGRFTVEEKRCSSLHHRILVTFIVRHLFKTSREIPACIPCIPMKSRDYAQRSPAQDPRVRDVWGRFEVEITAAVNSVEVVVTSFNREFQCFISRFSTRFER